VVFVEASTREGARIKRSPSIPLIRKFNVHGRELYEAAQRLDLEGIVAKRKADPYSMQTVWYKVKNPAYTQAEGRGARQRPHQRYAGARAARLLARAEYAAEGDRLGAAPARQYQPATPAPRGSPHLTLLDFRVSIVSMPETTSPRMAVSRQQ
jgi:hypothetical protein